MNEEQIVIVDGARTPIGSFGGMFKDVPAHELGAAAVGRRPGAGGGRTAPTSHEVVMGCIGQVGPDAYNARRVAVAAGAAEERAGLHGQPAVRLGPAGHLVGCDGDALERPRPHPRRR